MACPVCTHAQVAEIDANVAHLSLRQLETRYQVSRSGLGRHRQRCRAVAQRPGDAGEPALVPSGAPPPPARFHGEIVQLQEALRQVAYVKVTCASVLADRLLPRLKAVELSGDPDRPLAITDPEARARRIAELSARLTAHQNGHHTEG